MARPLNTREMSACLTGLRLLMAWRNTNGRNAMCALDVDLDDAQVLDILTSGGEFVEPDQEFLDNLSVNLNCGEIEVSDGVLQDLAEAVAEGKQKKPKKGKKS